MLDNFICSRPFFCRVKYDKLVKIRMHSNHTATPITFKTTLIKFKATKNILSHNNWKLIGYHKMTNEIFNNSPSKSIAGSTTYYNYSNHILESGMNTATIKNQKKKVWFHLSRNSLLPMIKERDVLISDY